MEVCLLKGSLGGNISREILLRSSKVISQQTHNRLINLDGAPTKINWKIHAFFTLHLKFWSYSLW